MNTPEHFQDAVDKIVRDMSSLLIRKQKDYGPGNILEAGLIGVLIRANDKLSRLKHIYGVTDGSFQMKSVNYESVRDSWVDLANYAIIAQMLLDKTFTKPMKLEDKENG